MSSSFNKFALEINLERFKSRYDSAMRSGGFEAYSGGRGPGSEGNHTPGNSSSAAAHNKRSQEKRRTALGMSREVFVDHRDLHELSTVQQNRLMPTYAELNGVAEKLEAYVRKLDGKPAQLPDVNLGINYQTTPSNGDTRGLRSCWRMPMEQLEDRINKQRALVAKWELRKSEYTAAGDRNRKNYASTTLRKATKKLEAALAIRDARLEKKESE